MTRVFTRANTHNRKSRLRVDLRWYPFFVRFCTFFVSIYKYSFSCLHFCMFISALTDCHILDKSFPMKIFVKGYSSILKYRSHCSYPKFKKKTFYQYAAVYLVWLWTYKNADEKAHSFSCISKNG